MKMMTTLEKVEIAVIPFFGIGFWLIAPVLPSELSSGKLILIMSALLLFQSLIRDFFLLASVKRMSHPVEYRVARCMCLESTVGITGILVGAGVLSLGIEQPVVISHGEWGALAMLIMVTGFIIKDFVVESRPWQIVRDKSHVNILFKWK